MKKIVVYTALSDGYDKLTPPPASWRKEADFFAFLPRSDKNTGWQRRILSKKFADPVRNVARHKILSHVCFPKAEYSLWIDGPVQIISTLALKSWVAEYLGECDLAVFKGATLNCVYQEALACIQRRDDSTAVIDQQMEKYHQEGYPIDNGLADCTVLFRRHTKALQRFNEIWYQEFSAHSRCEQLSFNYAVRKAAIKYSQLPGTIFRNSHFARGSRVIFRQSQAADSKSMGLDKPDVIILSHPRSGTHFLEASLASHPEVHKRGEFLLRFKRSGANELRNLIYAKKHIYANKPGKLNIAIVMYAESALFEKMFGSLTNTKIIHLVRNSKKVACSFAQMQADQALYGKNYKTHYHLHQQPLPPARCNDKNFDKIQGKIEYEQKHFSRLLANHPHTLEVDYDEITGNNQVNELPASFRTKILKFLNLADHPLTNSYQKVGK